MNMYLQKSVMIAVVAVMQCVDVRSIPEECTDTHMITNAWITAKTISRMMTLL